MPYVCKADAEEHDLDASEKERGQTLNVQTRKKKTEGRTSKSLDLSWVGIIIGLQDGDIEVHWANGMVSKVFDCFLLSLFMNVSIPQIECFCIQRMSVIPISFLYCKNSCIC